MRFSKLIRYALTVGGAAALLAACGTLRQSQIDMPSINAPDATSQSATVAPDRARGGATALSQAYKVLYRFHLERGVGSGQPSGGLIYGIYGTTQLGGRPGRGGCCGTVYSITKSGTYDALYEFRGEGDGASPLAGLINVDGVLYGTTSSGGTSNGGTVYSVTTSGAETVLHSFAGGTDGAFPTTSLFYYDGTDKLYGTTSQGGSGSGCGSSGCGTVYSITTGGEENVLYRFKGGSDGATPSSTLIVYTNNAAARGRVRTLYGTTSYGGGTGCGGSGCGTVYSITTKGQEKVLYAFKGGRDGSRPEGLDDDRGTLLGTTVAGGTGCKGSGGCGTVYSITPFGSKKAVYNFRGGSDGACPNGPLIDVSGNAYGTTTCGGGCSTEPCGTVYKISPNGTEQVLYRFTNPADGFDPNAPLTSFYPMLYGTTLKGGGAGKGYGHGVIFAVHQ